MLVRELLSQSQKLPGLSLHEERRIVAVAQAGDRVREGRGPRRAPAAAGDGGVGGEYEEERGEYSPHRAWKLVAGQMNSAL